VALILVIRKCKNYGVCIFKLFLRCCVYVKIKTFFAKLSVWQPPGLHAMFLHLWWRMVSVGFQRKKTRKQPSLKFSAMSYYYINQVKVVTTLPWPDIRKIQHETWTQWQWRWWWRWWHLGVLIS